MGIGASWSELILIGCLAVCTFTDLRRRKIYNAVVFPALALAIAGHSWAGGWEGAALSLTGFAAGFGLLLIPYLMGGMGAGDVKLLALIGALQGASFAFSAAVYMALFGLLMSILYMAAQPKTRSFLKFVLYTVYAWRNGVRMPMPRRGDAMTATMPYGVAIAAGTLIALFWRGGYPG
jgi:prepilin peptidase CpaA